MRPLKLAFALLFAAIAVPLARAADGAVIRTILIMATNQKAPADPKLAPYEAELQRNLPLSSFRYVSEGSASVSPGGKANIALARGHRVELEGEKSGGAGIAVKVQWLHGTTVMIGTTLTLQRGVPVVLGRRPSGDGETPIVLVIGR